MGAVVVPEEVKRQVPWRPAIDQAQELQPLSVPMPGLAHRDDSAVQRVERREQRCRAMALVVVGEGAGAPALHWQTRLRAVQRLNLAFLVAAEHQRMLRRVQVQPYDVQQLVLEPRIARELEGACQMRLDSIAPPDSANHGCAQSQVLGQSAGTPVRRRRWLGMQGHLQDLRLQLGRHGGRTTRARRVLPQRIDATLQEPASPQCDLTAIQADIDGDLLVLPALRSQQDHSSPLLKPRLDTPALGQHPQFALGTSIQFDLLGNPHRSSLLAYSSMPREISSLTFTPLH